MKKEGLDKYRRGVYKGSYRYPSVAPIRPLFRKKPMPVLKAVVTEQFKIAINKAAKADGLDTASFIRHVLKERLNKMGIKIKVKVIGDMNRDGATLDEWVARGYPLEEWVPVVRWVDED